MDNKLSQVAVPYLKKNIATTDKPDIEEALKNSYSRMHSIET